MSFWKVSIFFIWENGRCWSYLTDRTPREDRPPGAGGGIPWRALLRGVFSFGEIHHLRRPGAKPLLSVVGRS